MCEEGKVECVLHVYMYNVHVCVTNWHRQLGEVLPNTVLDEAPDIEPHIGLGRYCGASHRQSGLDFVEETCRNFRECLAERDREWKRWMEEGRERGREGRRGRECVKGREGESKGERVRVCGKTE